VKHGTYLEQLEAATQVEFLGGLDIGHRITRRLNGRGPPVPANRLCSLFCSYAPYDLIHGYIAGGQLALNTSSTEVKNGDLKMVSLGPEYKSRANFLRWRSLALSKRAIRVTEENYAN